MQRPSAGRILKNPSRHSKIQNAAKGFKMVEVSPSEAESRETSGNYIQVAWGQQLLRIVNCVLPWRNTFLHHVRSEPNSAPVRSSNGSNERAKAFCKSSSSLPLCMFDSAESSPELPTIKFCFTIFYYRHAK